MDRSDGRDEQARAAIRKIVGQLPEDHPAREAYEAGAGAIRLMSLVDRDDVAEKLNQAWLDWYSQRLLEQRKTGAA